MEKSRSHAALRRALLRWYDANRRSLPWRRSRDPYRIWVAEVMLQQTRIEAVKPAYARFLEAFPSLRSLAAAGVDEVLAQWSGLGYYTRARSLHRAARMLIARGASRFPSEYDEARTLPGVGAYTAAAVLSIAYGRPCAAVDGNIVRVLSRLAALGRPDAMNEPHASLAAEMLHRRRPGDWNQALMELGQTVCLPKGPRCEQCPVRRHCGAFARRRVHLHPPAKPRRKPERIEIGMTILRDPSGRILLRRGEFAHLPHMWLPPIRVGASTNGRRPLADFRHSIQHREFLVKVFARAIGRKRPPQYRDGVESRLFSPADLAAIGRSSLLSKALEIAARSR